MVHAIPVQSISGFIPLNGILLLQAFCAFQRLAPANGGRINIPVSLLFTSNEILFFEDIEMVGKSAR